MSRLLMPGVAEERGESWIGYFLPAWRGRPSSSLGGDEREKVAYLCPDCY